MTTNDPRASAIEFDERRWPLVRVTFRGTAADDVFDAYLARMSALVRRGERIATVLDARRAGGTPAVQRRKQAAWQAHHADELRKNVVGTAFVIDLPIIRGVLTAILWLSPLPQPHVVVATLDEADRWALERLHASGVAAPSVLRAAADR